MLNFNKIKISFIAGITLCIVAFPTLAFGSSNQLTASDQSFVLRVGETTKVVGDMEMTLLKIIDDSRCPSDVICIWEGTVNVEINLTKGQTNLGNHVIPLIIEDADLQTFNGVFIRISKVDPYPLSTTPIKPSEYSVTFLVSKVRNVTIEAPLKQLNQGIPINEIKCRENFFLIIKSSNSNPACVRQNTAEKLILRGWAEPSENQISINPTIKTGTSSGFCLGYCTKEFVITPEKIVYKQTGHDFVSDSWIDLPEKSKEFPLSQDEWKELIGLVDFTKFSSLPNKIGCPGCADAPVEWIEISYDGKTKKIEFEENDFIFEINNLINKLQEIRKITINKSAENFEDCVSSGNPIMESYPRQCRTIDGRTFVEEISFGEFNLESQCQFYKGNWLQEFNECEAISEKECSIMNGTFNECESACRHLSETEICTTQCVQVCIFS